MHPTGNPQADFFRAWAALPRTPEGLEPEGVATGAVAADEDFSLLRALALVPAVTERSYRQGLVLCIAGTGLFTAALFWRERIFGVYRHVTALRGRDGILRDLKDFRLGWLPEETVRETGGIGCVFAALPAEAEGFPVMCVTGPGRHAFQGQAKIYEL